MRRLVLFFTVLFFVKFMFGQTPFKTGVNFPLYLPDYKSIYEYLQLVSASGGKAIRQMTWADVHWKHVEPTDNNWDFSRSDSSFFNPYSLIPIGTLYSMMGNDTIGLQTPWLACSNQFICYWDPAGDSIYSKDYVFKTINRYKNVTKYWEVANEIESALPPPGLPNIFTKKEFLRYNYSWIKQADSSAKILLPGLVGTCCDYPMSNSFNWLRNMLGAGAGNYFDIMNYHDYNAWWTLPAHYDSVKSILSQFGLNKPIWITETAISSFNISSITPSYSSVDEQAADVWRRLCLLWAKGAEVVLWHSNWSSGDLNGWGEFGLISNHGIKKKSFHAYKLLNEKISDFSLVNLVSIGSVTNNNTTGGNGVWVIHFVVNNENKWVMWSPDNQPYTLIGLTTNSIKVTQVVPNQLFHGGDSAVFISNTYSVNGNSYSFNQLPRLPILVEETNTTDIFGKEKSEDITLIVYPNPAQKTISIQTNQQLKNAEVNIFNLIGERIFNLKSFSGNQLNIALSNYANGIYFITINHNKRLLTKKFIVQ